MFDDKEWNPFFKMFFWKLWPHGSVFFSGLLFGVFVSKIKPKKIKNVRQLSLIWTLITIGYLYCIYDNLFWAYGRPPNPLISAILYPMKKLIWSLILALLIWLCVTGNGGFVNSFLSAKAFIPLSRLTYSVYLSHEWIVWTFWGSTRDLFDANSIYSMMSNIVTVLFASYICGAIFSLLFESPFLEFRPYIKQKFLIQKEFIENDRIDEQNLELNSNVDLNSNLSR